MARFGQTELHCNGRPGLDFYCTDPMCGQDAGHGLRIFRLTGMDINICVRLLPVADADVEEMIQAGQEVYPPLGLFKEEAVAVLAV